MQTARSDLSAPKRDILRLFHLYYTTCRKSGEDVALSAREFEYDPTWMNPFCGDDLDILRKHVAEESVDLLYLDPPFNSNRDFNVFFKEPSGGPAQARMKAFTDPRKWSKRACPTGKEARLAE